MADPKDKPKASPVPTEPPDVVRVSDDSQSSAKLLSEGGQGKATVRTRYPVDAFDSGIDGVPEITASGVEVERSKVKALLEAAETAGVTLEEVS